MRPRLKRLFVATATVSSKAPGGVYNMLINQGPAEFKIIKQRPEDDGHDPR
jgi:hypothetical protein